MQACRRLEASSSTWLIFKCSWYELLIVDETTRGLITRRSHASLIRDDAVGKGMQLLSESGLLKVQQGKTTLEEIQRVTMRATM